MKPNREFQHFNTFPDTNFDFPSPINSGGNDNSDFNILKYVLDDAESEAKADNEKTLESTERPVVGLINDGLEKGFNRNSSNVISDRQVPQNECLSNHPYTPLAADTDRVCNTSSVFPSQQGTTPCNSSCCSSFSTFRYSPSPMNYQIKTEMPSYTDLNRMNKHMPGEQPSMSQIASNRISLRTSLRTPNPNPGFLQTTYVDSAVIEHKVNQATKKPPRKYRIKPETERVNPVYQQRREKNNDAVRRSREKAKAVQEERDTLLAKQEEQYKYLLKLLDYYTKNCGCGIKHPAIETFNRKY